MIELGGKFAYKKQNFGEDLKDNMVTSTYSGNIALYFWDYTALEFNFSSTRETTTTYGEIKTDFGYTVTGTQSVFKSQVYGVGLRQSFANRKAFFIPSLSLGYAKQFTRSTRDITFKNDTSGDIIVTSGALSKRRIDSMFATFSLKFRLTKLLSLNSSVNTLLEAGEWNKAKDNLKYMVGFSWYF